MSTTAPVHYRLRDIATGPGVEITVERYFPISETPKGYWVLSEYDHGMGFSDVYVKKNRRWVPKVAPRFCSPGMKAAEYSFKRRKAVQLRKLKWQLEQCRQAIEGLERLGEVPFPPGGLDCGVPFEWLGLRWE